MLYGGYRWAEAAGFFPWDNLAPYEDARKVFHDLYVIPRKQTSRLFAGRQNRLLFKVMNDTLSRDPVTFEWTYEVGGRQIARDEATAAVMSSLARLTDDQHRVVRLRFLGGCSVAETAAELGKTDEAVHALCYRALKELRGHLVSLTRYLSRL